MTTDIDGEGAVPGDSVALIVEISASTLDYDLLGKAAIYATAGIPEYWVVDIAGKVIRQMWAPSADRYTEHREVAFGERIEAATVAGLVVSDRLI